MPVKPDLLSTFSCADLTFEARRGTYHRPVSIWHDDEMVGYVPRDELTFETPHARFVPDFLASISGLDPWPGVTIATTAAAAYRPEWLKLDPNGPHQRSGGLNVDATGYIFYCANDGHHWPCPHETEMSESAREGANPP